MKSKFEIWKDGSLYLTCDTKKDAERMYKVIDKIFKPKHLQLYEIVMSPLNDKRRANKIS